MKKSCRKMSCRREKNLQSAIVMVYYKEMTRYKLRYRGRPQSVFRADCRGLAMGPDLRVPRGAEKSIVRGRVK